MSQLIWPILAIFLCLFPSHSTTSDVDDLKAKLDKLKKLDFTVSNNFYYTFFTNFLNSATYFIDEITDPDVNLPTTPREIAIQHPNIDIHFDLDVEKSNLKCAYNIWSMSGSIWPSKCVEKICIKRRNLLDSWLMKLPLNARWYMPTKALEANPVRNIADLESALNGMSEHDILRTCASAYFFEGEKPKQERNDWLLYLLEGRMECDERRNATWNGDVLARGYTVSLWQMNSEWKENQNSLCAFHAKLIQYKDNQPGGNFLIAAIVGSAQLDKMEKELQDGIHPDGEQLFWAWQLKKGWRSSSRSHDTWIYNKKWEKCAENYVKWLRNEQEEYMLRLEVTNFCKLEEDEEHSDDDEMIVTWNLVVNPDDPYFWANNGILDWKERPNTTAMAKLHLGKGTLRMPDGEVIQGQINFKKGGQKSQRSEL